MYSTIELFTMSYIVGGWSEAIVIHTDFCYAISRNFMAFQSRALYCLFGILRNFSHLGADFTTFLYFPFYFILFFLYCIFCSISLCLLFLCYLSPQPFEKQWSFLYTYLILFASLLCNIFIFILRREKRNRFSHFLLSIGKTIEWMS